MARDSFYSSVFYVSLAQTGVCFYHYDTTLCFSLSYFHELLGASDAEASIASHVFRQILLKLVGRVSCRKRRRRTKGGVYSMLESGWATAALPADIKGQRRCQGMSCLPVARQGPRGVFQPRNNLTTLTRYPKKIRKDQQKRINTNAKIHKSLKSCRLVFCPGDSKNMILRRSPPIGASRPPDPTAAT